MNPAFPVHEQNRIGLSAEQALVVRWLNAYLRESGQFPERGRSDWEIKLPLTNRALYLSFQYLSASGHHRYRFPIRGSTAAGGKPVELAGIETIDWLLAEVAASEPELPDMGERVARLREQALGSMAKTAKYLQAADRRIPRERDGDSAANTLLLSEQSLLYGHPFHPTPKSSEGFSEEDLAKYAPELGASFPLAYWAVHPEWLEERWLPGAEAGQMKRNWLSWESQVLAATGDNRLLREGFRLLPCHPWQSDYLRSLDSIKRGIREGKLVELGGLGEKWYPTSSVRTVWSQDRPYYLKLPIQVRITNFVRTNDEEQRRRSLDAACVWEEAKMTFERGKFDVLPEFGFLSIRQSELLAETTVLFRDASPFNRSESEQWHVAASLLEDENEPRPWLPRHSREAEEWVRCYADAYLSPVLWLFADYGISLEAHVQNALIRIEDGLPAGCLARDLEGMSVSRSSAFARRCAESVVESSSPVLYEEEEAWMRLLYYNLTNHWGHMLAAVSRSSGADERRLWFVTATWLADKARFGSERLQYWTRRLLDQKGLPAKANLISRFQGRGERPIYNDIPNPLREQTTDSEGWR